jgi:exodeoxyribonuclease V alpha subunit
MKQKPSKEPVTLLGSLARIIYQNNENGYLIASMKTERGSVSIVGYMPSPREGESYRITGRWATHPKYGEQVQFESYEIVVPTTLHGVEEYLSSGLLHGIGPALAARIVKKFGEQTLAILNSDPDRLGEVEGIGRKKLEQIRASTASLRGMQEVISFLKGYDVGTAIAVKIFKTYGQRAVDIVKNNPYQLIQDVQGIGFTTADFIAGKAGVERESMYRLEAGIRFVLDDACRASGHCFIEREELLRRAAELLSVDEVPLEAALEKAAAGGVVINEGGKIFPVLLHEAEASAAHSIERILRKTSHPFTEQKLLRLLSTNERRHDITFDQRQREAIIHAILQPVTILTGGPGTGKTLCVNGIIELADELGLTYVLCAPTGRAAKRLAELTQREAKTIHRLLEYDPISGFFRREEDAPIEASLIIVDEVSMVDIQLFDALLAATRPESQLVLVGDVDQLPSVGPGQVLRDLIESKKISTVRLNTIFRQAEESTIIINSHRINQGESPEFSKDFQIIPESDIKKIQETIIRLCTTILPHNHQLDPFEDIQVLSPMHHASAGVKELNKQLQQALNGHSRVCWQGSERKFLMGDKVMQVKNNYDKDIFNGDIGRVSGYDKEEGILLVTFYGRKVEYTYDELDELVLAYAMTIHKSQGNEFRAVIVPMVLSHYIMLQRNLLYTAVTRARELLVIVGEQRALAMAIRNDEVKLRNTLLKTRLR